MNTDKKNNDPELTSVQSRRKNILAHANPFNLSVKLWTKTGAVKFKVKEIAFFYEDPKGCCFELISSADRYDIDYTLDEIMYFLDKEKFFWVNDHYIVSRKIVAGIGLNKDRQMIIVLKDDFNKGPEMVVHESDKDLLLEWLGIELK